MKHSTSRFAVLALALSGFAAQAQETDLERQVDAAAASAVVSQPLQGIVITGNSNSLLRSDQRLAMLSASLPLGGNGSATKPSNLERVVLLFPREPNAATGEARRMMERNQAPGVASDPDASFAAGTR